MGAPVNIPSVRRLRARTRERGGVLFIIAMTMAVLASLGIYALNTAAAEIKMAGYERQSTMSHYISEYAISGAASLFAGENGVAKSYLAVMLDPSRSDHRLNNATYQCAVLSDVKAITAMSVTPTRYSLGCKRLSSEDMYDQWAKLHGWGPFTTPTWGIKRDARFYAEIADPAMAAKTSGNDESTQNAQGSCNVRVEVTAQGATEPNLTVDATLPHGTSDCNDFAAERLRAYMTVTVDNSVCK
jgi:hypothetical protein